MTKGKLFDAPGVYCIINTVNNKLYIGSSAKSVEGRVGRHIEGLRANKHPNRFLQFAWNKYREVAFVFATISLCDPEKCLDVEQKWMDYYKSYDREHGYNLSPTAASCFGVKHSDESRERNSKAQTGKVLSEAHKAKVSAGNLGKKMPEEAKAKLAIALVGNTNGTGNKGKTMPLDVRMKLVKDLTGNRYQRLTVISFYDTKPHARWLCRCDCGNETIVYGNNLKRGIAKSCGCLLTEHLAARNKANTGKKHTREHRAKISKSLMGNKRASGYR